MSSADEIRATGYQPICVPDVGTELVCDRHDHVPGEPLERDDRRDFLQRQVDSLTRRLAAVTAEHQRLQGAVADARGHLHAAHLDAQRTEPGDPHIGLAIQGLARADDALRRHIGSAADR